MYACFFLPLGDLLRRGALKMQSGRFSERLDLVELHLIDQWPSGKMRVESAQAYPAL